MPLLLNRYTLTLCPAAAPYNTTAPVEHLAGTRIELEQDERLFAAIGPAAESPDLRRCQPRRLPQNVTFVHLTEEGLHERTCDGRGNRLTFVTAGEIADLIPAFGLQSPPWNKAALAFFAALPRDVPVVLFWD